jgi:murein DD-endopeptidase MepM/ murein hydrolase activator NlpD
VFYSPALQNPFRIEAAGLRGCFRGCAGQFTSGSISNKRRSTKLPRSVQRLVPLAMALFCVVLGSLSWLAWGLINAQTLPVNANAQVIYPNQGKPVALSWQSHAHTLASLRTMDFSRFEPRAEAIVALEPEDNEDAGITPTSKGKVLARVNTVVQTAEEDDMPTERPSALVALAHQSESLYGDGGNLDMIDERLPCLSEPTDAPDDEAVPPPKPEGHVPVGTPNLTQLLVPVALNKISSPYGWRHGRMHQGIDYVAPIGTPIRAAQGGRVRYSGWQSGYGKLLVIEHAPGFETRYAHCSRLWAGVGQHVEQGQAIAAVGTTGHSTGPHLHFEVWRRGIAHNPSQFVRHTSLVAAQQANASQSRG